VEEEGSAGGRKRECEKDERKRSVCYSIKKIKKILKETIWKRSVIITIT
jgi:hypothetical protein